MFLMVYVRSSKGMNLKQFVSMQTSKTRYVGFLILTVLKMKF